MGRRHTASAPFAQPARFEPTPSSQKGEACGFGRAQTRLGKVERRVVRFHLLDVSSKQASKQASKVKKKVKRRAKGEKSHTQRQLEARPGLAREA